jgi:anti-sigma regulatory factor (Ser/Thr protein kinase)
VVVVFPPPEHPPEACQPPEAPEGPEPPGPLRADSAIMQTELPAELPSARRARSAVRQALTAWGMDDLSADAELLASELVANAAEHGDGKPISLALRRHADCAGRPAVTCEVTDSAPRFAPQLVPGPDAERGRGLMIVEALARSSGVWPSQAGRTSWFTLAGGARGGCCRACAAGASGASCAAFGAT